LKQRIARLQDVLRRQELEAVLITTPANLRYLSGFDGTNGALLVDPERSYLLTDFRYLKQAEQQAPHCLIRRWVNDLPGSLAPVITEAGLKRLGFEKKQVTFDLYQMLAAGLEAEMIPVEGLVENLRAVKDEGEIEVLRRGAACLDLAFSHILGFIKPGLTEEEISLELEIFLRRMGAQSASFRFIVASGERGAMPHAVASKKRLAQGELVTMDFGALFQSYATDMTRTVCLGKPEQKQKHVFAVVREALERAAAALKPGMTGKEADAVARGIIVEAGFGEYFGHGLGHGLGLEAHEWPVLSPRAEMFLEAGMTLTVEPGIYISGWGGVRLEDMMLITATGAEAMTFSSHELTII
jgi:Xaa-Pro aminopeptidase